MKVEKRGDKYRIQPMINGKRRSITLDHKPTQQEILAMIEELKDSIGSSSTFEKACLSMISDKSNVLSPSTIRGYKNILKGISPAFKALTLHSITSVEAQKEINKLSTHLSPKSVSNYYGLITSVVSYYLPNKRLKVKLPTKAKEKPYCPTTRDIKILLEDARDNGFGEKYILPIMLGCYGMRLGEVAALTDEDIDVENRLITINKAMVLDEDNNLIVKPTAKTEKSNRVIQVVETVIQAYLLYGLYDGYPKTIGDYMRRREKVLGLQHFSYHKLRHYFASTAIDAGLPLSTIQDFGGWSTPRTLQSVYQHNMRDYNEISEKIGAAF